MSASLSTQLTAENEQLKESLKRVTSEKEQIEATYRNKSQHKERHSSSLEASSEGRGSFERMTEELIEKARLDLVREEVERQVAERMRYTEPMKVLAKRRSMESAEIVPTDDQAVNLSKHMHYMQSRYTIMYLNVHTCKLSST